MSSATSFTDEDVASRLAHLEAKFREHKQEHVFQFVPLLNADQKRDLLMDVEVHPYSIFGANFDVQQNVDPAEVRRIFEVITTPAGDEKAEFTPFEATTIKAQASAEERKIWWSKGLDLIASGEVAVILMAGGQGTRLKFDHPKGCYDIGLPSRKSLFQLQAERIQRLRHLAAQASGKELSAVRLPWYIMASDHTRHETEAFFGRHARFGLPEADIFFFEQGELPALTSNDGRIIMQSRSKVALSPNGNGGVYSALDKSGALADMKSRGVNHVHVYGVDNVLVTVADPSFIGFAALSGKDCANKVVLRDDAKEKVGTMVMRAGKPTVIEYTEVFQRCPDLAEKRNADNQLVLNAANIANHYFSRTFLERLATERLPFHVASKTIPTIDAKGATTAVEGTKMEMFVFDSFPLCPDMVAFAVSRDEEFSPVKNAPGPGSVDSPDTARAAVFALHARLVARAGGAVDPAAKLEISPLLSYQGEGLEARVAGQTWAAGEPVELTV